VVLTTIMNSAWLPEKGDLIYSTISSEDDWWSKVLLLPFPFLPQCAEEDASGEEGARLILASIRPESLTI